MLQSNLVATRDTQEYIITLHHLDYTAPIAAGGGGTAISSQQSRQEAEGRASKDGRGVDSMNGELVKNLEIGDSISLYARSRFPGWENHVKRAEIRIYWAV
jgi:hypothetical protein